MTKRAAAAIITSCVLTFVCTACGPGAATRRVPALDVTIPFSLVRNQILVQAMIAGRGPYSCMVDTGANPSVIDLDLAQGLGLAVSEETAFAEGVGTEDVLIHETTFDVLLGKGPPSTIAAVTLNLSALSAAFGQPINCVLGQSWLGSRAIQIDYPSERLHFSPGPVADPEDLICSRSSMIFWMQDDLMPLVEVEVNGVMISVTVDTGSSGTLKLFPAGALATGVALEESGQARTIVGARGSAQLHKIMINSLRLGPIYLTNVQGSIGEKNIDEPEGRLGNIGNGLLRGGLLTLDFPARQISVCASRTEASDAQSSISAICSKSGTQICLSTVGILGTKLK